MKRVLFLLPSLNCGGSEHVLLEVLKHLDRRVFEPNVAVLKLEGSLLDQLPTDVTLHHIRVPRARFASVGVADLCWRLRPASVLSTSAHLNCSVVIAKPFLPREMRLLLREGTILSESLGPGDVFRRWAYCQLYRRGDTVICQSKHMAADLNAHFGVPVDKIVTIPNPVDIDGLKVLAGSTSPYRSMGPNIVAVGSLSPVKRFDLLIRVFRKVLEECPTAELTIVGAGELKDRLGKMAHDLDIHDCVHIEGHKSNPYPYIRHAAVLVQTSAYEGLPNVVLEAVALGTKVLALDCPGGTRDIAATTRYVQMVKDEQALAPELVRYLISPKRPDLLEAAFLSRFGVVTVVRQYEALLSSSASASAEHQ